MIQPFAPAIQEHRTFWVLRCLEPRVVRLLAFVIFSHAPGVLLAQLIQLVRFRSLVVGFFDLDRLRTYVAREDPPAHRVACVHLVFFLREAYPGTELCVRQEEHTTFAARVLNKNTVVDRGLAPLKDTNRFLLGQFFAR